MTTMIPKTQTAVQLTAPDCLVLNTEKPVLMPSPYQILCRIEAVGLCYSDLKLLKQFSSHTRKGEVLSGIDWQVLDEIPGYVPCEKPAVPGHEAVVRVCAVGGEVKGIRPGDRRLVQTDYRWLATAGSNAAFGYNFEGALQQYVIMDQRVITSPDGRSMLIPAAEELCASAIALVEPWACVEQAYSVRERTGIAKNSRMLVVADEDVDAALFNAFVRRFGRPAQITHVGQGCFGSIPDIAVKRVDALSLLDDAGYDDVLYFGCSCETVESLFTKVASSGLFNIILCGKRFNKPVRTAVGRVHYGGIRLIGTVASNPADSMRYIPACAEISKNDKINIVGAAGPMGLMHVVRNICQGISGVTVYAGDLDETRIAALTKIAQPLAEKNSVTYQYYNPVKNKPPVLFNYTVLMAPIPELVDEAVQACAANGIINIFAGIPASVTASVDLDSYIEKHLYFVGTSGSTLDDMETVLAKVQARSLDTNISVAAVSGLAGAIDGIRAVENHTIAGKIIVYPQCRDLPLIRLDEMAGRLPGVAGRFSAGLWTKRAENALIKSCR